MTEVQTANSFALSENLIDQSNTETSDIVELTDEQLEAVAGGWFWAALPNIAMITIIGLQTLQWALGQEQSPGPSRAVPTGQGLNDPNTNPTPKGMPPIGISSRERGQAEWSKMQATRPGITL